MSRCLPFALGVGVRFCGHRMAGCMHFPATPLSVLRRFDISSLCLNLGTMGNFDKYTEVLRPSRVLQFGTLYEGSKVGAGGSSQGCAYA